MACRTFRRISFSILFLAGFILPTTVEEIAQGKQPASANQPEAPKSAEAMIEARGKRQLRQLNYTGWRKLCFTASEAATICRTTIAAVAETGQQMLRVDLIEGAAAKGGRLQIFVPPMLFLEAGVRVSIGGEDTVTIPFAWCFSNTCVAARAVDAAFIRRMRSGRTMTLKAVDARISTILTSLPLDRFASINLGSPSITFGRSLESKLPDKQTDAGKRKRPSYETFF